MDLVVASWNINSVRLRADLIAEFLKKRHIDIMCLQETKCEDEYFPSDFFSNLGFAHQIFAGQKSYNGVAILSRLPIIRIDSEFEHSAARYIAASVAGVNLHNFYVPAGGDIPDVTLNDKFADKINFLEKMQQFAKAKSLAKAMQTIWVGDFNIAPYEHDVWSHKQLIKVVSHTPIEVEKLNAILQVGGFVDVARHFIPASKKAYSWWSYRGRDWQKSNRGRRLDHIWVSEDLRNNLINYEAFSEARGWERPSDHVPIIAKISV